MRIETGWRYWILLVILAVSIPAWGTNILTNPGFENGLTGWYSMGSTISVSSVNHSGGHSAYVSNRTQNWNGIAQSLLNKVEEGKTYKIGGWVRLADQDQAGISLTLHRKNQAGEDSWHHVVDATCYQDRWVEIKGYYIFENLTDLTTLQLYFEGPGAGVSFYADDVIVEAYVPDDWNARANARIEQIRKRDMNLKIVTADGRPLDQASVQLRQIRHQFGFGTAFSSGNIDNPDYLQFLRDHYEWVVPENATKWTQTEPGQGQLHYNTPDEMVEFCRAWNIYMRGHCLFWSVPQFVQDWVKDLDDTDLQAAMEARLNSVVPRYADDFYHWDVNNEMLHGSYYADRLGDGIRAWMFQQAQALDPDCQLFVNDYNILNGGLAPDYKLQIESLIAQGAPVGGIGVQGHMGPAIIGDYLWDQLDILAETGLPIWVTEYDVDTPDENLRADALETFYRTIYSHPATQGILMWGFWENAHWRENAHLVNADWTVNAAGRRYEALLEEWTSHDHQNSSTTGAVAFRPFHGAHEILITHPEHGVTLKTLEMAPADEPVQLTLPCDNQGLRYEYYEGSFATLPDFDTLTPVSAGYTGTVNLRVADKVNDFALRFRGYLFIETAGNYIFRLGSDDGSRLLLDGLAVMNNDGLHAMKTVTTMIPLNSGMHAFELQFMQGSGNIGLELTMEGPGYDRGPITVSLFYNQPKLPIGDPDLSGDLAIDLNDFVTLSKHWQKTNTSSSQGNLDRVDTINTSDLMILTNRWLDRQTP